jgi:hypothetical protein
MVSGSSMAAQANCKDYAHNREAASFARVLELMPPRRSNHWGSISE